MKKLMTILVTFTSFSGFASITELSKSDLALEVGHCYVGHERAQTDIFKSGKAEELKPIIANLIGKADVNKTILRAKRIQTGDGIGIGGTAIRADKVVEKYCSSLEEKMAIVLK